MDTVKHYSIGSDILYFIRHFLCYEPVVLVCCGAEIVLGSLLPLISIYLPKIAIDLVSQGAEASRAMLLLGGFALLMIILYGLKGGVERGKYILCNLQRTNMIGLLFLKSLRIKYEYAESGEIKKVYGKACRGVDREASSRIITGTISLLISLISFFLYSTVIGYLSLGMLAAMMALSLVNYLLSMSQMKYEESLREESATAWKHYGCVSSAMGDARGAKDIRIFRMQDWLLQLRDIALGELKTVDIKSQKRHSLYEKVGYTLAAGRDLGAYAYLLYQTFTGTVNAGEFVLFFGAITGFSGFLSGIMEALASLRGAANDTDYLRAYLELPEEDRTGGVHHIEELQFPPEIEFRNVSFSYHGKEPDQENEEGETPIQESMPGGVDKESGTAIKETGSERQKESEKKPGTGGAPKDSRVIFCNLNLTIHPGEKIALVGVNGAGKTTLVKLLCGMYEPDEGQILIGGIDRKEFPREEIYRLFSVVFQEQLILPFTVGENLAMDRVERVDEQRAWEVLEKAGLKEVFIEKGIGIHTYMTRMMMENGVELSGGQQQRFLLARALYKDGPVLILDEPTAALDPIAESQIYAQYNRYSQGKTALFISHRLASTHFSDRIVLLENGRIAEVGTHEELMRAGGAYAEMYEIQSSYYL